MVEASLMVGSTWRAWPMSKQKVAFGKPLKISTRSLAVCPTGLRLSMFSMQRRSPRHAHSCGRYITFGCTIMVQPRLRRLSRYQLGATVNFTAKSEFSRRFIMVLSFKPEANDMTENLKILLEAARKVVPTPEEKEQQRRSFAYGNTKIENSRITREMVDSAADALGQPRGESSSRSE